MQDKSLKPSKVKPQARGACYLVRYADDFICMVRYKDDAQRIEQALRERFAKFNLELHPVPVLRRKW